MTPNQLRRDRVDRIGEVESSGLGGDLRVKHALKQNVAEFTGERSQVAAVDRVEGLVGFLEQVRPQRRVRLFAIPWAAARRPQRVHQPHQSGRARGRALRAHLHGSLRHRPKC